MILGISVVLVVTLSHFWFYLFGPSLFSWWVWLKSLSVLFVFSKNPYFFSLTISIIFYHFYFIFALTFILSFLLLTLRFLCSFPSSCRCVVGLLIWNFLNFLRQTWITISFPPRATLAAHHRFWIVVFLYFSFVSRYIYISSLSSTHLWVACREVWIWPVPCLHCLFSSILCTRHMFVSFAVWFFL